MVGKGIKRRQIIYVVFVHHLVKWLRFIFYWRRVCGL